MECELDQEFGQFNSSKVELDSRIKAAETVPSTADKKGPEAATVATKDTLEAMAVSAEAPARRVPSINPATIAPAGAKPKWATAAAAATATAATTAKIAVANKIMTEASGNVTAIMTTTVAPATPSMTSAGNVAVKAKPPGRERAETAPKTAADVPATVETTSMAPAGKTSGKAAPTAKNNDINSCSEVKGGQ